MKFVIMGCGRLGRTVATELDSEGHEVVVIDFDEGAFHLLPAGFSGRTVLGNGVDKRAGATLVMDGDASALFPRLLDYLVRLFQIHA